MMYLFDDGLKMSQLRDLPSWEVAEHYAKTHGWTLIGEFQGYVDEETGEKTYIQ